MALNSFDATIVTRGGKRSQNIIAHAAYNARDKLIDERTNDTKDYSRLDGLEWDGIFLPTGAPPWMADREKLWNEVERREDRSTRPDTAQLARSWIIAFPHELNAEERRNLIAEFANEVSRAGIVVDAAIHQPDRRGDVRNYHAHLLLTMREIEADGFGNKMRHLNRVVQLAEWKDRWSEIGARHLERAGFEMEAERFRQGHLSLVQQRYFAEMRGDHAFANTLDREPNIHLGPDVSALEREGLRTVKGDEHRAIKQRTGDRAREESVERPAAKEPARQTAIPRDINEAWDVSDNAHQFAKELHYRNLHLAVIRKDDVQKEIDVNRTPARQFPNERQIGQFVVLTNWGRVYPLNERTTGSSGTFCQEFMSTLNAEKFPGIAEKTRELGLERNNGSLHRGEETRADSGFASRVIERAPLRVMAAAFDSVSDAFESLFASPSTKVTEVQAQDIERLRQEERERLEAERER